MTPQLKEEITQGIIIVGSLFVLSWLTLWCIFQVAVRVMQ